MIVFENVSKVYQIGDAQVHALDNASIRIEDGEFVSIIGPSGSGKSTMMNIIGCLDVADSGRYLLDGQPIEDYSETELARIRSRKIGFIFQSFNLIGNLTAEENVELPLIYRGMDRKSRRKLARESLKMVGLENRMTHKPSEMSGGQQQRVAIARAIAAKPPVILADEPTGNLDSASSKEILGILRKLHAGGRTVILITHDDGIASQAKRVVRIMDGKIETDMLNPEYEETEYEKTEENHEEGNIEE